MLHSCCTKVFLTALVSALLVTGCAVRPGDPPVIDRIMPLVRLAVMLGTDRVLVQNPDVAPVVVQVSRTLLTLFNTNEAVSLAEIHAAIRAKLATMNLAADTRVIIEALLESVVIEVRLVIVQAGVSDDKVVLILKDVVNWIAEAAMRHVQGQGPVGAKKGRS